MKYIKKFEGVNDINYSLLNAIEWDSRVDRVKKLIEEGADIEFRDPDNDNASMLMTAIIREREQIAMYLVEQGADLNHQDDDGVNALMCAGIYNSPFSTFQLLIDAGAEWNLEDDEGREFIDFVIESKEEMIKEDYPEKYAEYYKRHLFKKDVKKYNL